MTTAYIALGSNLGDRGDYLERALAALWQTEGVEVTARVAGVRDAAGRRAARTGSLFERGCRAAHRADAPDLLNVLLSIEQSLGRTRQERDGPRTIDLDLLLYDDLVRADERLTVPHPRLHERLFVLQPLAQLAPGLLHPTLKRGIADLLAELQGLRLYSRLRAASCPVSAPSLRVRPAASARPSHWSWRRQAPT